MLNEIDRIRVALQFVDPRSRDTWLTMGMAIKSEFADAGFELWEEWSKQAESYNAGDARAVWRSIKPYGKVTIGTLIHAAKASGWRDDGERQTLKPEEIAERRRIASELVAKEDAERAKQHAESATKARAVWESAFQSKADNAYLVRKRVSPVATLKEIDAGDAAVILGYAPKSKGELMQGRLLVVPIKAGGKLASLELIDETGRKTALAGGRKSGGYWATEPLPDHNGEGLTLLLGEGVATVLSAKEATGYPAIAALSCGNLLAVSQLMRERYPAAAVVILADLVKSTGEPDTHAVKAAQAVNGRLAIPDFGDSRPESAKDFNDMSAVCGFEAVARAVALAANAATPARGEPAGSGWPEPYPLTSKIKPEIYPIDALPDPIRAAVEEVAAFVKAPVPLVASSALAALSLAGQAHVDAKRAERLQGPSGLFLLTIADSGERKSTCDNFFTQAIRDYEQAEAEAAKLELKDYRAELALWEAACSGTKEKIRQLAKDSKPTEEMGAALRRLEHGKPKPPKVPRLLYADTTPEALADGLAKQWPSAGVLSAEAGIVFGSHGMGKDSVMRNLGLLNQLWDGTSLTIDRRTTESITVRGARLTMGLQVQERTLREFFARSGALARGTGFLARFLLACPESTQGRRFFTDPPPNWPSLAKFHRRIIEILSQSTPIDEDGALKPAILMLEPQAKAAWVEYHDAIESELASGGELYDVRDVASKSADNAVRLAALFQMFKGAGGAISADAFEGAGRIVAWHLSESRRFFGELALPPELADAARLDNWLIDYCQRERTHLVGKNHVRQHGPLRDGVMLDAAIRELVALDRLQLVKEGKRLTIHLNPLLVEVTS